MPIHESTESTVAEADRRAERAKASFLSRVDELKHKLGEARDSIDVQARIANHPLPAVAIAFALGALAGLRGARAAPAKVEVEERSLSGALLWALGALGLRVVRELALGQLGEVAKQWWAERHGEPSPEARPAGTPASGPIVEP